MLSLLLGFVVCVYRLVWTTLFGPRVKFQNWCKSSALFTWNYYSGLSLAWSCKKRSLALKVFKIDSNSSLIDNNYNNLSTLSPVSFGTTRKGTSPSFFVVQHRKKEQPQQQQLTKVIEMNYMTLPKIYIIATDKKREINNKRSQVSC